MKFKHFLSCTLFVFPLSGTDYVVDLGTDPSTTTEGASTTATPVIYQIYRHNLKRLIAEVSANRNLRFKDRHVSEDKAYTYYALASDQQGSASLPAKVKIKSKLELPSGHCTCHKSHSKSY